MSDTTTMTCRKIDIPPCRPEPTYAIRRGVFGSLFYSRGRRYYVEIPRPLFPDDPAVFRRTQFDSYRDAAAFFSHIQNQFHLLGSMEASVCD